MKYITFNSGCAYAGLANLLEVRGVDTTDRQIALDMGLPYLFAREGEHFLSGPMLQSAAWFALYLQPLGLRLKEVAISRENLSTYLQASDPCMLGLLVAPQNKHAVIFTGMEDGRFSFLNNRWEQSDEPDTLTFGCCELSERVDETVMVAALEPVVAETVDRRHLLEQSLTVLEELLTEIRLFCTVEQSPEAQFSALNRLFRPLLLDGITMLELIGKNDLAFRLKELQSQLLTAMRGRQPCVLSEHLDLDALDKAAVDYAGLIRKELET